MTGVFYRNGLERPSHSHACGKPIPTLIEGTAGYQNVYWRVQVYFQKAKPEDISVRETVENILHKFQMHAGVQELVERQGDWSHYIGKTLEEIRSARATIGA